MLLYLIPHNPKVDEFYFLVFSLFHSRWQSQSSNIIPTNLSFQYLSTDPYQQSHLIYNSLELKDKIKSWNQQFPYIIPYYAMKSNPYRDAMVDLISNNVKIDVGSQWQIKICEELKVRPEDIVYSNTIKAEKDLIYGYQYGIRLTVADSFAQIKKIKTFAPQMRVLWRIAIKQKSDDLKINNFFTKFGDQIQTDQQIQSRMRQISLIGINLKGIHFNTGPEKYKSTGFDTAIKLARRCIEIGRKYGHQMSILNVGGGFPAGQLSQKIINSLKQIENDPLNYQIIAQPGRFYSNRAFYLLARVIGKKHSQDRTLYYLNQSTYQSFRLAQTQSLHLQNTNHHFYSKKSNNKLQSLTPESPMHTATIYGMTCSRNDIITNNIQIPNGLEVGDWLCFGRMGAYSNCFISNYNGMRPENKVYTMKNLEIYRENNISI